MARKKPNSGGTGAAPRDDVRVAQQAERTSEIRKQAEHGYDYNSQIEYDEDLAAKRAGIGCLVAVLIVLAIIAGVLLFGYVKLSSEIKGKNATATSTVTIEIGKGSGAATIARQLKETGLIGNDTLFRLYTKFGDTKANFQQGEFQLQPGMSYDQIIEALSVPPPPRKTIKVTFPEGSTVWQFGQILEEKGICAMKDFVTEANKVENYQDIEFFSHIEYDPNTYMKAEGYLAPNTYEFFEDDKPEDIVRKLYEQFNKDLNSLVFTLKDGSEGTIYDKMAERDISLRDTITLASLVEEEAGLDEHKNDVAGVFWNRLRMEGKNIPRTMGSDVTFYYIRDFIARDYGGKYENVREQNPDLYYAYYTGDDSKSPRLGLPAGPISNPNVTAIKAALMPTESGYLYFLTDFYGNYYYAKEFWEHEQNIRTMEQQNEKFKNEKGTESQAEAGGEG